MPSVKTIPSKLPFWSAIITQQQGYLSIPASSFAALDIQPPAGETWLVWIDTRLAMFTKGSAVLYYDFDGSTGRLHTGFYTGGDYGDRDPHVHVLKVLTNSLYAHIHYSNAATAASDGFYGYSGFKLSKPHWSPIRETNLDSKPWKKPTDLPLPAEIEALDHLKAEILGLDPLRPNEYTLGVILEENTPLAKDPNTGFAVERLTVVVEANTLANLIKRFKSGTLDPVKAGYKKYLNKWKAEGIKLL